MVTWRSAGGGWATVLVTAAPFAPRSASLVMSDAFGALLVLLAVPMLALSGGRAGWAGGALADALVVVRLGGVVTLAALCLALLRSWRVAFGALVAATPFLVGLAVHQWLVFGSPLRTGYDYWLPGLRAFDLSYVLGNPAAMRDGALFPDLFDARWLQWLCPCPGDSPQGVLPNLVYYPMVLLGLFWVFTPPLVPLVGLVYAWRHRAQVPYRYVLCTVGLSLVMFELYFYQAARFMAGPASLLAVASGAAMADWLRGQMRLSSAT